ncbi:hypothetical protein CEUSTIGMA_g13803.t1 [Chlamydomonas eustigma]|uniref:N-acetyltransferase domain-containing protein n=1 Tax=Chlamydomonas eustigma TaxID=1157962 RepID=A0A250XTY0_9CHLO|nr:hypothetical protein CEUSTIGMA_g13803.t1 [Chlamydomonas eustigma]|eukprot:GAX86392.1 hypothetical protein CEUSTIGMA_g13803.t1 [Chlamydomonas eustigma]
MLQTGVFCKREANLGLFQGECSKQRCQRTSRLHITTQAVNITATTNVNYEIRIASSAAELRAAAYLRAHSFYHYPEGRSVMAARAHRRMKGDSEWESVTSKVSGTDVIYKDMKVKCIIAAMSEDQENNICHQMNQDMDLSTKLPANPDAGYYCPQLVIGSLDLNVGSVLPAEELIGKLPEVDAKTRRAYLSNVCVAKAAQRQGIAQALMLTAEQEARREGVQHLYVHVVLNNEPAVKFYQRLDFELEAEESVGFARALDRPRRKLLHKCLQKT